MKTSTRTQFLDLVQQFRLATEANREALASEYQTLTQHQASQQQPIQPVLGFCMDKAGSKERAEAMFQYVLSRTKISYWPIPSVVESLRHNPKVKEVAFTHGIIPIKLTEQVAVLCGTNPHDVEGIQAVFTEIADGSQYPIFVLSEPEKIMAAMSQFA